MSNEGIDEELLREELVKIKQEHHDLDTAIHAMEASANCDTLQVKRMKKRKLVVKDRIELIEDKLMPDIIA